MSNAPVTNDDILAAVKVLGQSDKDSTEPLYKRLGDVEKIQSSQGAMLTTALTELTNLSTKLDRFIDKRETKMLPIVSVAVGIGTLILGIVIAVGSLTIRPIEAAQTAEIAERKESVSREEAERKKWDELLTEWQRRIQDVMQRHIESEGHPRMVERVESLMHRIRDLEESGPREREKMDEILQREMRILDDRHEQGSQQRHEQQAQAIHNVIERFQRELKLAVEPINRRLDDIKRRQDIFDTEQRQRTGRVYREK